MGVWGRVWMRLFAARHHFEFLFTQALFKVKVPPKLEVSEVLDALDAFDVFEVFGTFCTEDGLRTLPSTEPIGVADWWNPTKAFGEVGPVAKNPTFGEEGS